MSMTDQEIDEGPSYVIDTSWFDENNLSFLDIAQARMCESCCARLSEEVDATPIPEWVPFAGKYLGLSLVLVLYMGSMMLAGIIVQTMRGYYDFEVGRYVQMLLGFQLPEYLLFAALAFGWIPVGGIDPVSF